MIPSDAIKKYIKSIEGLHRVLADGRIGAYKCPAGVWTIGYGTTRYPNGKRVYEGDIITPQQAEDFFEHDIARFAEQVNRLVQVPLTQAQFDALVSFVYNVGGKALEESTLLKKLNNRDCRGASKEFLRWDKANGKRLAGLTKRREYEKWLFESSDAVQYPADPNNTPLRNRDLPMPHAMREDVAVTPRADVTTPVVAATGGVVGVGAVLEAAGQAAPLINALHGLDWRVASALLGLVTLGAFIWFLRRYR